MIQSLVFRVSPELLYSNVQCLVVGLCWNQVASQWARALWRPLRWKLLEAWPNANLNVPAVHLRGTYLYGRKAACLQVPCHSCQIPTCLGLGLAVFGPAPARAHPPKQRRLDRGAWMVWPELALALALRCRHCIFGNSHSLWPPFASCASARLPRRVRCQCCQTVPVNARCASTSWHCRPENRGCCRIPSNTTCHCLFRHLAHHRSPAWPNHPHTPQLLLCPHLPC